MVQADVIVGNIVHSLNVTLSCGILNNYSPKKRWLAVDIY